MRDGETYCIISQPYGLTTDGLRCIAGYCYVNNLDVEVSAYPSWHFPGSVITVVFKRKDENA